MKKQLLLTILMCSATFHLLYAGEEALRQTWQVLNAAIMENRTPEALAAIPPFIHAGGAAQVRHVQILPNEGEDAASRFILTPLGLATLLGRFEVVVSLLVNGAYPEPIRVRRYDPQSDDVTTQIVSLLEIARDYTTNKSVYSYLKSFLGNESDDDGDDHATKRKRR